MESARLWFMENTPIREQKTEALPGKVLLDLSVPQLLKNCLSHLRTEKMNLLKLSKSGRVKLNLTCPGTGFTGILNISVIRGPDILLLSACSHPGTIIWKCLITVK